MSPEPRLGPGIATRRARVVVVGTGIAGLTTALELGDCTVIGAAELGDGASRWAQGGIAAALGPGDDAADHAADTCAVAGGLADAAIAGVVAGAAADRIAWLESLGATFDRAAAGGLVLGREAGHRAHRIVHARGDATGAAVMAALTAAVRARGDIEVLEHTRAVDLIRGGHHVVGVVLHDPAGSPHAVFADAVVLATGGIGRLYSRTTNPPGADGDGLALAARAGAVIRDPEFVQFHPTALLTPRDPLPLLTEALRGAGATLIDADGHRFLTDVHPDAELAPRDVVARACWVAQGDGPIHLDARVIGSRIREDFPTVFDHAAAAGLDPRVDPLPVTPAQHYHMGGVASDADGRTSLPGLYVCGEAAATGLHGANRLASNSLLEALVFGARVADAVTRDAPSARDAAAPEVPLPALAADPADEDRAAITELREAMWRGAGLVRDADGLASTLRTVHRLGPRLAAGPRGRNLATVAELVLTGALGRRESRGSHQRSDAPQASEARVAPTLITPAPVLSAPLPEARALEATR